MWRVRLLVGPISTVNFTVKDNIKDQDSYRLLQGEGVYLRLHRRRVRLGALGGRFSRGLRRG